ncbi:MAG: RNA polymerase sigma factor [Anaerolineaceae bacterium]|nr:RNA polymerase sigma factor [Anaerolineaceae bacterium]
MKNTSNQEQMYLSSEEKAILMLKKGDISGLSILVQKYQVKAVHTALIITHDLYTAEEVVQDSFVKVFQKISQFDETRPFGPWFLRIVINAAIKMAKKQKKFLTMDKPDDENYIEDWLIDQTKSPEELAESAEIQALVWQAIEKLSPNQRAVIVLKYFLEDTESEIVNQLGKPLTTIKWWLFIARQRLKQMINSDLKNDPVRMEEKSE